MCGQGIEDLARIRQISLESEYASILVRKVYQVQVQNPYEMSVVVLYG